MGSVIAWRDEHCDGQGGIRTLETVAGLPVFETGSFSHSDTCPKERGKDKARTVNSEPGLVSEARSPFTVRRSRRLLGALLHSGVFHAAQRSGPLHHADELATVSFGVLSPGVAGESQDHVIARRSLVIRVPEDERESCNRRGEA